jgi:hypothetical protein
VGRSFKGSLVGGKSLGVLGVTSMLLVSQMKGLERLE